MAKCPKCGEEIDHLSYFAYELQKAYAYLTPSGNGYPDRLEYINWDSLGDVKGDPQYECPECSTVLATSEEGAVQFLKQLTRGVDKNEEEVSEGETLKTRHRKDFKTDVGSHRRVSQDGLS